MTILIRRMRAGSDPTGDLNTVVKPHIPDLWISWTNFEKENGLIASVKAEWAGTGSHRIWPRDIERRLQEDPG